MLKLMIVGVGKAFDFARYILRIYGVHGVAPWGNPSRPVLGQQGGVAENGEAF